MYTDIDYDERQRHRDSFWLELLEICDYLGVDTVCLWVAHIDESGTTSPSPVVTVAAAIASAASWAKHEVLWRRILKDFNIPAYHATEFWSNHSPVRDEVLRLGCNTQLIASLNDLGMQYVAYSVEIKLFESIPIQLNRGKLNPYDFLLNCTVADLILLGNEIDSASPIIILYASGAKLDSVLIHAMHVYAARRLFGKVTNISAGDQSVCHAFQVADLIAHEAWQYSKDDGKPIRRAFREIKDGNPFRLYKFDPVRLTQDLRVVENFLNSIL